MKILWHDEAQGFIRITTIMGKPLLVTYLDDKIAKGYSGYRLILKDLHVVKQALDSLEQIRNAPASIVKQSLSFYAIVTYAKCFTQADGRGIKLDKSSALSKCSNPEKIEHNRIMDQRHNYVAHGGLAGYEHNPLVVTLNPNLNDKKIINIHDNVMGLVDIDSQLDNFQLLTATVTKFVTNKCETLIKKIERNIHEIDLDKLYEKAIDPSTQTLVDM